MQTMSLETRNLITKGTSAVNHGLSDHGIRSTVFGFKSLMCNGIDDSLCGLGDCDHHKEAISVPREMKSVSQNSYWSELGCKGKSALATLITSIAAHLLPFLIDTFFPMKYINPT